MVAHAYAGAGTATADAATTIAGVTYRPMAWADMDAVTEAFEQTWGHCSSAAATPSSPLLSRHFVLHYLEPATRADIAERDGRFMGVTLARVAGRPAAFPQTGAELAAVNARLEHGAPIGAQALHETERWHRLEETLEERISINDTAQAEIELFLVAGAARGHGVGGSLWRRVNRYFAGCGVEWYYLHTDSSCDVGFYDHHGMQRVLTRLAADHPEDGDEDDLYIYAAEPERYDRPRAGAGSEETR